MTNRFIFLEDNDMAYSKARYADHQCGRRDVTPGSAGMLDGRNGGKGGYSHFMLKEIFEQPQAISDTLLGRAREEEGEVEFEGVDLPDPAGIRKIWMVACGTSHHACMIGKNLIETSLRIPVETDMASEFRYRDPIVSPRDLFIGLPSGDGGLSRRWGSGSGASTLSICNVSGARWHAKPKTLFHACRPGDRRGLHEGFYHGSPSCSCSRSASVRLGIFGPEDVREVCEIRAIPARVKRSR